MGNIWPLIVANTQIYLIPLTWIESLDEVISWPLRLPVDQSLSIIIPYVHVYLFLNFSVVGAGIWTVHFLAVVVVLVLVWRRTLVVVICEFIVIFDGLKFWALITMLLQHDCPIRGWYEASMVGWSVVAWHLLHHQLIISMKKITNNDQLKLKHNWYRSFVKAISFKNITYYS